MEDLASSPTVFSSPESSEGKGNEIVLPTTTSTLHGIRNAKPFLVSCSVFCLFVRWGLPRLVAIFKSNSTTRSPSSSSSSSAPESESVSDPPPGRPYDVYLNYRGADVRQSLASIIYRCLQNEGFRVFFDVEELQPGEELQPTIRQAISSALVHIAIFSKGYAESSRCLDELWCMWKSGAMIIPVFYDVQPSDLRRIERGVYGGAFAQHERKGRVSPQKLDEWKEALRRVSGVKGLQLNDPQSDGDMGKAVKCIVDVVSKADWLHKAVEEFENFLQCEARHSNKEFVKIVGIVGVGGSGKTTLAKEFYNRQRTSFPASSFLCDVRDAAALQPLQGKLLNDLLHISDHRIERFSVSDGRAILTNKLRSSTLRALIVLDDIGDESQVEALFDKDVLGSGSLILMTSREEGALKKSGADAIFKIEPLKSNHAPELFRRHAFLQPRPKRGFEDLDERVCQRSGGSPLFLKVMGGHLPVCGGDDKAVWSDELEYIPDHIKNMLKICYDALAIEEKEMFLDVACFFLGEHRSMAIRLWKGSNRRASTLLRNLQSECLVDVDDENCLKMNDYIRDFAREIAEQESSCRFWDPHQFSNIGKQLKGRKEVRGIIAATGEFSYGLTHDSAFKEMTQDSAFKEKELSRLPATGEFSYNLAHDSVFNEIELSRLQFLAIKGDCLSSGFEQQLTNLLWLRWYDCPHTAIPSRFTLMKNLTVLHIFGGVLEKWEVCDTQLPLNELAIRGTRLSYISIPEDMCPQLEHLELSRNEHLAEVEHLPPTLELLNLSLCTALKRISTSFYFQKLKVLDISGCHELEELPELKQLTSLETLRGRDCWKLQNIQGLEQLTNLQYLCVAGCFELCELSTLSGLTSLRTLEAWRCRKLQNIQGLGHLPNLQYLAVDECSELAQLPNLSGLISLETLEASGCSKLQNLQGLEHLSNLRRLRINQCSELGELPNLSGLASLETLEATGCSKLQHIRGLERLSNLQHLSVDKCFGLGELPNLSGLISLKTLEASGCNKLQNIQGLEHLSKLQHLRVNQCSALGQPLNLSNLTSLETLEASGCSKLRIQGLEHWPNFQCLER